VRNQLMLDRDPHGNVQLSKVETERLLIELVQAKMDSKITFNAQPLFFGYEGRSCLPSLFDANYGYNLGRTAALLIREGKNGCMSALTGLSQPVSAWKPAAVPLISMMALTERKSKVHAIIEKALVDLDGGPFHQWKKRRTQCALEDQYLMPGPIQFYGPAAISERTTKTLEFSFYVK
jgi:pyrophosphate--fructose-6-phosphate 1-phosphotransferase